MPTTTQTGGLSSQTLEGADGANNTDIIYGDANKLKGTTVGGADTIIGGDDGAINYLYGDAYSMEGKAKGGADKITGGSNGSTNYIYGDTYSMQGKVQGGNDVLVGGVDSKNIIYGDAYSMRDGAKGGNDFIKITNDIVVNKINNKEKFLDEFLKSISNNNNTENISIENKNISLGIIINQNNIADISIKNNLGIGDARNIVDSKGGDDEIGIGNKVQINTEGITSVRESYYISSSANSLIDINSVLNNSSSTIIESNINSNLSISNLSLNFNATIQQEKFSVIEILHNELEGDGINATNSKAGDDSINIGNSLSAIANVKAEASGGNLSSSTAASVQIYNFDVNNNLTFTSARSNSNVASNLQIENYYIDHDLLISQNNLASINLDGNIVVGDANNMVKSSGGNDAISVGNSIQSLANIDLSYLSYLGNTGYSSLGVRIYTDADIQINSEGNADFFIGDFQANLNYSLKQEKLATISVDHNQITGDAFFMINSKGGDDNINVGNDVSAAANIKVHYLIIHDNEFGNFSDYEISPEINLDNHQFGFSLSAIANFNIHKYNENINLSIIQKELTVANISDNVVYGDSQQMKNSMGGSDVISIANYVSVSGKLSNDLSSRDIGQPIANGNVKFIFDIFQNDLGKIIIQNNFLYGDAETMMNSKGGDDTLSIGARNLIPSGVKLQILDNSLYGDAKTMTHSKGGNDKLTGADGKGSITYLYGDAQFTDGHSKAGDDVLTSGQGNDQMWGDFASVLNPATSSNNHDHGDDDDDECGYGWDDHESDHDDDHHAPNPNKYAGKDTFVFKENNGNDTIFDFQHGLDKIDLKGLANIHAFSDLQIAASASQPLDSVIDLGGGNSITLVGVNHLEASDFLLAA